MNQATDNNNTNQLTARRLFNRQVIFGTSFVFLTSGVFLSGLAIYMGADDLLISYISMITNICGISILFFSSRLERFHSYKKITLILTALSKLATLMIVLIPLFFRGSARIAALIPLMIIAFTLQAQTTVVLNNWMVSFVKEESGRYIAQRQTIVLAVTVVLSLTGGRLLDSVSDAYSGFAFLFLIAFFMSIGEMIMLSRIPDAIQQKAGEKKNRLSDMVCIPMKCKPFLRFVVYIVSFYLILTISDSFTVVYMMRYLNLSYVSTTVMQMIFSLPQIFLLGIWGKICDKKGHHFVLTTSIWFFPGETLFLALSNQQNYVLLIPLAFLFGAIGNSGFVVSVFNRRYELMPKEGRILYDNFYSAAIGLAFILGPFIGGGIKTLFESSEWITNSIQYGNVRFLYVFSTLGLFLLQVIRILLSRKKD